MTTDTHELAWAAGFFDGEAHIGLARTNNKTQNRHLHIQICQTEDGPLERFTEAVNAGKIYGPYNHNRKVNGNQRPYKQLHIATFEKVQQTVCLLWPWLSTPKKNQAKMALIAYRQYQERDKPRMGPAPKPPQIPSCHPNRMFKAKGMCDRCYRRALKEMRGN